MTYTVSSGTLNSSTIYLRYVEPVQLGVQHPQQAPVELVGTRGVV